jgi:hypothetical protein
MSAREFQLVELIVTMHSAKTTECKKQRFNVRGIVCRRHEKCAEQ